MLPDEQTANSQQHPTVQAMLPRNGSSIELASTMSEKSQSKGQTHNGFTLGDDSKGTSPSSSSRGGDAENQKSTGTTGSNDDTFVPEWRKTKRKFAKRTIFVEVLMSVSANASEGPSKKRKSSAPGKPKDVVRRAMKTKFRKHIISRLLITKAGGLKSSTAHGSKSKTGQVKEAGKSSHPVGNGTANDEHRRRSKRERHIPQKLGPLEVIQDVNDRDIIFGRPSGGLSLPGNRLLGKMLSDITVPDSAVTR